MGLNISAYVKRHITYDGGETLLPENELIYSGNITHNLNKMAMEAGIYKAVWRPYELHINFDKGKEDNQDYIYEFEDETTVKAKDVFLIIENGFRDMKKRPEHYKKFDSPNGWGLYENFIPFLSEYLDALRKYPEAIIECNR